MDLFDNPYTDFILNQGLLLNQIVPSLKSAK